MESEAQLLEPPLALPPRPIGPPVAPPTSALTPVEEHTKIMAQIQALDSIPDEIPVKQTIGKSDLMRPNPPYGVSHNAIPLLEGYANDGCPVQCGPPWSRDTVELLLKRGPHRSALKRKAIIQLRAETEEKINNGYARVVKWEDIKNDMPVNLKISPVAMIPHASKPYRCILDLSFSLTAHGRQYQSVNDATTPLAPPAAMSQLGHALKRVIATMAENYNLS